MAEYVCPFCGRTNDTSPDSEERDLMMECPRCGGSHLHRRYPDALGEIDGRDIVELIDDGCSPAEAVDYLLAEAGPFSQSLWSVRRNCTQQAVSENVAKARDEL